MEFGKVADDEGTAFGFGQWLHAERGPATLASDRQGCFDGGADDQPDVGWDEGREPVQGVPTAPELVEAIEDQHKAFPLDVGEPERELFDESLFGKREFSREMVSVSQFEHDVTDDS